MCIFFIGFIFGLLIIFILKKFFNGEKKLIFCALDFTNLEESINFTNKIKNHIGGAKLGLEFFTKNGPNGVEK